jgi:ubiquinone/menaquinone biosynthesis C-methylase UbiE
MSRERGPAYWDELIVARVSAQPQRSWRLHADRVNADLCTAWWPRRQPARVLKTDMFDEATGAGLWPTIVERAGMVCGIDHSMNTIRSAQSRYSRARTVAADVRHLPFRHGSFDLVISNSTLDHFERREDIGRSLAELYRVLAPGGRLILTLDNASNPLVALRNALPFWLLNEIGLVPYFVGATAGPRRGRQLLAGAGFEVVDVTAVMHCPRAAVVGMAALIDRLAGLGTQRTFARLLGAFETCSRWRTRFLTGYFVAFAADKP